MIVTRLYSNMALFQHALQVCTIACITILMHGHVLLAVNVEDFRNLANQFLSKNLAAQLSHLVSAEATRRDATKSGNQDPEIDINKVAELIKAVLLNEYRAHVASKDKVTRKRNIKRFSTVQNTVDMDETQKNTSKFRNPNYETTSPGLVYVKDDLDELLQINTDDTNSDQLDYDGTRLKEGEKNTLSQEPTDSKGLFDVMRDEHAEKQRDLPIKYDYTETKLGQWLFNHILSQKPMKIQNHKMSNLDINDEGNTEETPDQSENERRVQYVYETHLSGRNDKIKQNVQSVAALRPKNKHTNGFNIQDQLTGEHDTINEYVMRPTLKPQKQLTDDNYRGFQSKQQKIDKKIVMDKHKYVKPIQGNENTFDHGNISLDQDEGSMQENFEEIRPESVKAESSLYDAVEGKHQPLKEHITYDKYILGSKGKDNPQKKNASNKHEADRSSNQDQLLLRHKKGHPVIKSSKNHHYLSDKEVKSDSVKSKMESLLDDTVEHKDQHGGSYIKFSEEKYTYKKPQNKPIEENDVYEKYALGADTEGNNHGKVKLQLDDDYVFNQTGSGMKHEFDQDDFNIEDDEFYNKDKSVLGNTESDSSVKVAKHGVFTTKVPMKKEKVDDDLLPDFQAAKLGSSSSDEIEDKKSEKHDTFNKYDFEKYEDPYKPKKQPIEKNDMYKTHSLGSKDKDSKDREVKNDDDKYGYQETVLGEKNKRDHPVRDKDEENDMNEKHSLGSAEKNSNREVKRDYTKNGYKEPDFGKKNKETVLGKKYKGDHRGFDKDEEYDMYHKYSLGTKYNNSRDREDDEIDNDTYGYKETVSGKKNNEDHRVRNKEKENDVYDSFSQGSKEKDIKDREVKNDDDKYGYQETVNKRDHPVRDKDDENDMNENHSLGSAEKNSNRVVQIDYNKNGYKEPDFGENNKETFLGKKYKGNHRGFDKYKENDMYHKYSLGNKYNNSTDREYDEIDDDKYGYKETVSGKKNNEDHRVRHKEKDNDMYDNFSQGSKDKDSKDREVKNDDDKYGYKETDSGKQNVANDDDDNDKYILGSKVKKSRVREFKKNDKYEYKETVMGKKNKGDQRQLDKEEENNMYDKYSQSSNDKNSNTEAKKLDNNNYVYKDTVLGKKNRDRGRHKDPGNNDELLLKNKNRHLMKGTNKVKESKDPSEGYSGDPRPSFKEVHAESIKAKTESLLDSVEEKGKPTKRFTMKGTLIPKREFYKLSSPNYYKDLPRIVDKYDFDEPLPERDRQRDKARYLKREPSRVNRKLKLPMFEKVNM